VGNWLGLVIWKCIGVFVLLYSASAWAQKSVHCPDGDRIQINVREIAIQYDASAFAGTLSSLSVLGARLDVAPTKLQEAAVATQQWNELLKGLAAGYNSCAITGQQYADGVSRVYPRLKEDATELDVIRKLIADGQKADAKRLENLLASYMNNLWQFAQVSGKGIILERIANLSQQVETGRGQILQKEDQLQGGVDQILAKLNAIEQRNAEAPVPTPAEVGKEISEVRKELLAKADAAEQAYNMGYKLLDQYRFRESIPYLQQALAAVPLPDFYLTLGRAYREVPDLSQAKTTLRQGLDAVAGKHDEKREAALANQLGLTLMDDGDLDGALAYTQQALKIDEKIYGPDYPEVATVAGNIGQILKDKGDLDGALTYTERALKIDERFYGPDHSEVAAAASNIGAILTDKGDLDGALAFTQRALKIDEKIYAPDHPNVAIGVNNIGQILKDKGDLDGALTYTLRALKIDEKVYGPDHPEVATDASNIGVILKYKGDLDGALTYTERALKIDEKVYGPDHPNVATDANNIGQILKAKGDLDEARTYTERALKILTDHYGADNPQTKAVDANLKRLEQAKEAKTH